MLAANELRDAGEMLPSIIGPEIWSGEAALTSAGSMNGAGFSAVSDSRYRQVATSDENRFGAAPYRLATLGYDAVLLALRVARDWTPGTPFPTARMTDAGGFLGIDGAFRFRADGVGERAFEVREVGDGAFSTVDPAPTRF